VNRGSLGGQPGQPVFEDRPGLGQRLLGAAALADPRGQAGEEAQQVTGQSSRQLALDRQPWDASRQNLPCLQVVLHPGEGEIAAAHGEQ
jgi:hypothetical protein